ncbi:MULTISPECIES: HNH endonuclease [unclassified Kitasatospora]|uniref:HNH endonuclease n=1 Tax=unclassified Kitasatospora TaxID=2633591 RepID=UPI00340BD021
MTLGEEAHIIAENDGGPRADPRMPKPERDSYANMILLCEEHHKVIDSANGKFFSVDQLLVMKSEHEERVKRQRDRHSQERQAKDENMAALLSEWERQVLLDDWDAWTSWLLSPHPRMTSERFSHLQNSHTWVKSRFFPPGDYRQLARAFKNFSLAWGDLMQFLDIHFKNARWDPRQLELHAKYKEIPWDPPMYERLGKEFDDNCDIVHLLTMQTSAAANFLLSAVRESFDPVYRFDIGFITVTRGPDEMLRFQHYRPEYSADDLKREFPYLGMDKLVEGLRD